MEADIIVGLNEILRNGSIPKEWKEALIYPVPKGNGEFRPISLLCTISKLLEKIVTERLNEEVPMRDSQFGCRKGHNAQMALARFIHYSSVAAEEGKCFGAVSIDLSKAYDRVNRANWLISC